MMSVDDKDLRLLMELQQDAKAATSALAKRTGIPTTTVHNRIRRMEEEGLIQRYAPVLDHKRLGLGLQAMVFVTAQPAGEKGVDQEQMARAALKLPGVERVSILTGVFDIVLQVRVPNVESLEQLLIKSLRKLPGVDKTQTMIVLDEFQGTLDLGLTSHKPATGR